MNMQVADTILAHWKSLILIWIGINVIMSMPSPASTGPTSHWAYKWAFAALHSIAGGVPRIVMTIFPQSTVSRLFGNGNDKPTGGPVA